MTDRGRAWVFVRTTGVPDTRVEVNGHPQGIGRGSENRIVLQDQFASAQHAELILHQGARSVRDLGSSNGTRLNGRTIAAGTLHPLRDGDILQIGSSEVTYHQEPAGSPSPQPRASEMPSAGRSIAQAAWTHTCRFMLRLVLLLLLVSTVVAAAGWLLAPPRVALLVMGSDARPDELRRGLVGRTDTMLAVVADRSPATVTMISLPRDLWAPIPGHGQERINAAYALGGARTAERSASDVLGVPVDRSLVIGLQGVRDIVDAAGGVEIDVARPIHDDAYPTDDYGTVVVDIPAGRQQMDGETALRYARTRHQDSDFGRMARQQQVMLALRTRMLQPANWWRLPAVIRAAQQATQTNLGLTDLVTLGLAFGGSASPPDRLTLDLTLVEEFRGGDGAYLLRPRPALKQRVALLLTPTSASVEVLNGTRTEGLARQAADTLRSHNMRVTSVGDTANSQAATTIEVCPGCTRAGLHVASILGVGREAVRESVSLPGGVDVRVTLGPSGTARADR